MRDDCTIDPEIYLDACATTPPLIEVVKRIYEVQQIAWGNPSSLHGPGLIASELLERSRSTIAECLNANPSEIIFTSGATESVHLGILGFARNLEPARIVLSSVEHPSVISAAEILMSIGWTISYWPVDNYGKINLEYIDELLTPPTKLVSIISAQGEVGTIQPTALIGKVCAERSIIFHTDATQSFVESLPNWSELPVDLLSASGHKFQGPKGVGILLCKKDLVSSLEHLQGGGGQEQGIRSGTEAVPLIAGLSKAIEILSHNQSLRVTSTNSTLYYVESLRERLYEYLMQIRGIRFTGDPVNRLHHHISMLLLDSRDEPLSGRAVVRQLARLGVSASSGTACSSGKLQNSSVLDAMNIPKPLQQSGLRFSLGPWLREEDIDRVPDLLCKALMMSSD